MHFPPTNWALLAQATLNGDTSGRRALADLCTGYRPPVVAFLRQRGHSREESDDLAQQLFAELMEKQAWRRADQSKGRFRTFLLGVLMFVISRESRRNGAEKRGGDAVSMSLEEMETLGFEPADPHETNRFDRQWALQLVDSSLAAVEQSGFTAGKQADWQVLVRFLPGSGAPPAYEDAAAELGLSLPALKSAVNRIRQKFREELRRMVSLTVSAPHEIDEELSYLRDVLTRVL